MYKKSLTHYIAKYLVDVLFILSILCVALFPLFYGRIFEFIGYAAGAYKLPFALTVEISGMICAYILFILKKMYFSLLEGNPFTDENVKSFRKMAVACFLVFIIYALKTVLAFTLAALVITVIFMVGCIFCLTLKDLFKQAVNYKTENDLTI